MKKIKKGSLAAVLLMALFALASLFHPNLGGKEINISGLTLIIGIPVYFIAWKLEKSSDLLDFKGIPKALKDKTVLLLLVMPMLMNAVCNIVANLAMPEFLEHLRARTAFLSMNQFPVLLLEFAVAALGEEIAWRAFFQNQLSKALPFIPALMISSALFAVCHCTQGNSAVVLYDLLFVFINALFYGAVFKRTNNAFVSALAHFLANVFAAVWMMFW